MSFEDDLRAVVKNDGAGWGEKEAARMRREVEKNMSSSKQSSKRKESTKETWFEDKIPLIIGFSLLLPILIFSYLGFNQFANTDFVDVLLLLLVHASIFAAYLIPSFMVIAVFLEVWNILFDGYFDGGELLGYGFGLSLLIACIGSLIYIILLGNLLYFEFITNANSYFLSFEKTNELIMETIEWLKARLSIIS